MEMEMRKTGIGNETDIKTYEFPSKPVKKTLAEIIYDSQAGTFLGRTAKNWGQLLLFYVIFYTVLAALFAICLQVLFTTLTDEYPKWQLDSSLIGSSPGLGFRPTPDGMDDGNTFIRYKSSNESDVTHWVDKIDKFLLPYKNASALEGGGTNQIICDFDKPAPPGKVCAVDLPTTGDCTSKNRYGFNKSAPCIFVKLNRIYDWEPLTFSNIDDLPTGMPVEHVSHINALTPLARKQIWISCNGKPETSCGNATDIGKISYGSLYGLPAYYYPYRNVKGYLSPLVAVQFQRPPVNCKLQIECQAWAQNVVYRGGTKDRRGSFSFELQIDTD